MIVSLFAIVWVWWRDIVCVWLEYCFCVFVDVELFVYQWLHDCLILWLVRLCDYVFVWSFNCVVMCLCHDVMTWLCGVIFLFKMYEIACLWDAVIISVWLFDLWCCDISNICETVCLCVSLGDCLIFWLCDSVIVRLCNCIIMWLSDYVIIELYDCEFVIVLFWLHVC